MAETFNKIPLHVQDFQKFKMLLDELVQDEILFIEGLSKYSLDISSKNLNSPLTLEANFSPIHTWQLLL